MFSKELFAERLLALRKERGEKQEELAQLLGVSRPQVSEMEQGNKGTSLERFALLCDHFNVTADYLLGLTDERRPLKEQDPS